MFSNNSQIWFILSTTHSELWVAHSPTQNLWRRVISIAVLLCTTLFHYIPKSLQHVTPQFHPLSKFSRLPQNKVVSKGKQMSESITNQRLEGSVRKDTIFSIWSIFTRNIVLSASSTVSRELLLLTQWYPRNLLSIKRATRGHYLELHWEVNHVKAWKKLRFWLLHSGL